MQKFYLSLSFLLLCHFVFGQTIRPNVSFGEAGKVITPIRQEGEFAQTGLQVLEQSSGRLVVVFSGRGGSISFARHFANGTLDSSFGYNGLSAQFGAATGTFKKALVLPNDQIVVAGTLNGKPVMMGLTKDGQLNPAFGTGGYFYPEAPEVPGALAATSDGKILSALVRPRGQFFDLVLVRYKANGLIDRRFGKNGYQTFTLGSFPFTIASLLVLPDNSILLGGMATQNGADQGLLVKLTSRFEPDQQFGQKGVALNPGVLSLFSLAVQPGGKIVALEAAPQQQASPVMLRFTAKGYLDAAFGNKGRQELFLTANPVGVVTQADGKIITAGTLVFGTTINRYNADGSRDMTYGTSGRFYFEKVRSTYPASLIMKKNGEVAVAGSYSPFSSAIKYALLGVNKEGAGVAAAGYEFNSDLVRSTLESWHGLAMQPGGRLLALGKAYPGFRGLTNFTTGFTAARYLANGSLDPEFASGGKLFFKTALPSFEPAVAATSENGSFFIADAHTLAAFKANGTPDSSFGTYARLETAYRIREMALLPGGKLLLLTSPDDFSGSLALLRLLPNGSPDASFGPGGQQALSFAADFGAATLLKVQPDGKVLVAAGSLLARFSSNGQPDAAFAQNGQLKMVRGTDFFVPQALALQPDGAIVCAGIAVWNGNTGAAALRLRGNGNYDVAFGQNGLQWLGIDGVAHAGGVAIGPNGGILVGGYKWNGSHQDFALLLLNNAGQPDKSFGVNGVLLTDVSFSNEKATTLLVDKSRIFLAGETTALPGRSGMVAAYQLVNQNRFAQEATEDLQVLAEPAFRVVVLSNPSVTAFTLQVQSQRQEPVSIKVTDAQGRLVHAQAGIAPNSQVQVGSGFAPGVYVAEITQGAERTTVKLVKQ